MSKIALIHWNQQEAQQRLRALRGFGHEARWLDLSKSAAIAPLAAHPPDAFVIDLGRLPSHGRAIALALRQTKGTRQVPLVFVGGAADKLERIRAEYPDAGFVANWEDMRVGLDEALRSPPADPVVPRSTSGNSGTPLARKLGIRSGSGVTLLGAPRGFEDTLAPLPADLSIRRRRTARGAHVVVLFVKSRAELERRLPDAQAAMDTQGSIWVAWPKRASGVRTDLSEGHVREYCLKRGLVDFKVCAIDATWSGLRFAPRRGKR
ncbi:MAG: hypothetical protein CHACPFDD_01406 [Phycisphaerae bacterium]|nr:hypothetical protein [Phycisphaerae bacterium]